MEYQPVLKDNSEAKEANVCAWCDRGHTITNRLRADGYHVSHGICRAHHHEVMEELKALPSESMKARLLWGALEEAGYRDNPSYTHNRWMVYQFEMSHDKGSIKVNHIFFQLQNNPPRRDYGTPQDWQTIDNPNKGLYVTEYVDLKGRHQWKTSIYIQKYGVKEVAKVDLPGHPTEEAGSGETVLGDFKEMTCLKYYYLMEAGMPPDVLEKYTEKWRKLAANLKPPLIPEGQVQKVKAHMDQARELGVVRQDLMGVAAYAVSRDANAGWRNQWETADGYNKVKQDTAAKWLDQFLKGFNLTRKVDVEGTDETRDRVRHLMIKYGIIVGQELTHQVMDESHNDKDIVADVKERFEDQDYEVILTYNGLEWGLTLKKNGHESEDGTFWMDENRPAWATPDRCWTNKELDDAIGEAVDLGQFTYGFPVVQPWKGMIRRLLHVQGGKLRHEVHQSTTHAVVDEGITEATQWDAFALLDFIKVSEQDSDTKQYYLVEPDYNPRKSKDEQLWLSFTDLGVGKVESGSITIHVPSFEALEIYNAKFPIAQHELDKLNGAGMAWLSDYLTSNWNVKSYPDWESEIYQLLKDHGWQLASNALMDKFGDFMFSSMKPTQVAVSESFETEELVLRFRDFWQHGYNLWWVEKSSIGNPVYGCPRFQLSYSDVTWSAFCCLVNSLPPLGGVACYVSNEPFRNEKDPIYRKEFTKSPVGKEIMAMSLAEMDASPFLDACIQALQQAGYVPSVIKGGSFEGVSLPQQHVHVVADESILAVESKNVGAGMDVEVLNFSAGPRWLPAMVLEATQWMGKPAWHLLLENGDDVIRHAAESEVRFRRHQGLKEDASEPEHFEPGEACFLKYGDRLVPMKFIKDLGKTEDHHWMRTYRVAFADASTIYVPGSAMDTYAFNVVRVKQSHTHQVMDESSSGEPQVILGVDEKEKLATVCAWCDTGKKVTKDFHKRGYRISHGIRNHCFELMKMDLKEHDIIKLRLLFTESEDYPDLKVGDRVISPAGRDGVITWWGTDHLCMVRFEEEEPVHFFKTKLKKVVSQEATHAVVDEDVNDGESLDLELVAQRVMTHAKKRKWDPGVWYYRVRHDGTHKVDTLPGKKDKQVYAVDTNTGDCVRTDSYIARDEFKKLLAVTQDKTHQVMDESFEVGDRVMVRAVRFDDVEVEDQLGTIKKLSPASYTMHAGEPGKPVVRVSTGSARYTVELDKPVVRVSTRSGEEYNETEVTVSDMELYKIPTQPTTHQVMDEASYKWGWLTDELLLELGFHHRSQAEAYGMDIGPEGMICYGKNAMWTINLASRNSTYSGWSLSYNPEDGGEGFVVGNDNSVLMNFGEDNFKELLRVINGASYEQLAAAHTGAGLPKDMNRFTKLELEKLISALKIDQQTTHVVVDESSQPKIGNKVQSAVFYKNGQVGTVTKVGSWEVDVMMEGEADVEQWHPENLALVTSQDNVHKFLEEVKVKIPDGYVKLVSGPTPPGTKMGVCSSRGKLIDWSLVPGHWIGKEASGGDVFLICPEVSQDATYQVVDETTSVK